MHAIPEEATLFNFVLFGATGDLAMRKIIPALFSAHLDGKLHQDGRIICVSNQQLSQDAYLDWAHAQAGAHVSEGIAGEHAKKWQSFLQRITYVVLDATNAADYALLGRQLNSEAVTVFYLATSPKLFEPICNHLAAGSIALDNARVVLEKPLGHDLQSSRAINDAVARVFAEDQIYRIDHYLGKESVQNLLALRFANSLFEPLWRRESIEHVQLTIAEQLGVEGRGEFYDGTGALRDMVQNHLLQLLCMVAMEPPTSLDANAIRDEKVRVLRALKPFSRDDLESHAVRGQYAAGAVRGQPVVGYHQEAGIPAQSKTESFIALHAEINNWRWAGVPFFLRTGKRLAERTAEIVITFRPIPHAILPMPSGIPTSNRLVIRLQPEESIQLHCFAKEPGDSMTIQPVALDLAFDQAFKQKRADAYERLLLDVIRGNLSLFVRRDEQEAAWRWVEPLLNHWQSTSAAPKSYLAGSWGPSASSAMMSRAGAHWPEDR
ncbi:glucose-6-phosphate 1-dehydrogenase [Herbaspirillum sp. CF444]|uniref:glucose-6-phosphate dehydrogenase n=1 Tax=Herbaspirillum sp. CF444 TaxID=1144319 RepID=UPI0002725777|nr:glucose-6-phosphate dehydrogenase [Herbaspirillum sp. CF444]EJL92733.1 glucose-6-phosphate 1-dehydrogenase [Herbaspirillum sp. CF444]